MSAKPPLRAIEAGAEVFEKWTGYDLNSRLHFAEAVLQAALDTGEIVTREEHDTMMESYVQLGRHYEELKQAHRAIQRNITKRGREVAALQAELQAEKQKNAHLEKERWRLEQRLNTDEIVEWRQRARDAEQKNAALQDKLNRAVETMQRQAGTWWKEL